jgi:hypothetical protein
MFQSTNNLAQQLIRAGSLRNELYLEMQNLDPPLVTATFVRFVYFRDRVRQLTSRRSGSRARASG